MNLLIHPPVIPSRNPKLTTRYRVETRKLHYSNIISQPAKKKKESLEGEEARAELPGWMRNQSSIRITLTPDLDLLFFPKSLARLGEVR